MTKIKHKELGVPIWASFFTQKEYVKFIRSVEKYFSDCGATFLMDNGVLQITTGKSANVNLGLLNIAQVCKSSRPNNYLSLISEHFDNILTLRASNMEQLEKMNDFAEAAPNLVIRIYPKNYVEQETEKFILSRALAGNSMQMLVFDLPTCLTSVKPEQAARWNIDTKELFRIAHENTQKRYPLEPTSVKMGVGFVWMVETRHFFAPNIVLELEQRPELIGNFGSLVSWPNRHVALVYPIQSTEVFEAFNYLLPAVVGMYEDGPGGISTQIFWYKNGIFENIPYTVRNSQVSLRPEKRFSALLKAIRTMN